MKKKKRLNHKTNKYPKNHQFYVNVPAPMDMASNEEKVVTHKQRVLLNVEFDKTDESQGRFEY